MPAAQQNKAEKNDEPVVVRAAIDTRNAADQLLDFGLGVVSWGVWALLLGVGFASAALGLRFEDPRDMQAPEFISCLAFSSIVAVIGAVVYLFEHITRRTVYGNVLRIQRSGAEETALPQGSPLPSVSIKPEQIALRPSGKDGG